MRALFDTNILIDYLNGIAAAQTELDRYSQLLISVITWMEVLAGATPEEEGVVRNFLARFEVVAITASIADKAVLIRRSKRIRLPDAIIEATAHQEQALLISRNTKDFPEREGWVRVPYKL